VFDTLYVSPYGIDSSVCGFTSSTCLSLTQAVSNINASAGSQKSINVEAGEYTGTAFSVSSIAVNISASSDSRPTLSLVTTPSGVLFLPYFLLKICIVSFFIQYVKVFRHWR
jgi:hypothetical protein